MSLEVPTSSVFTRIKNSASRIVVNEGSSRSTKTYSSAQYFIMLGLQNTGLMFTITRAKLTWLKASAMIDFFEILDKQFGLYDPKNRNKVENTYELNGNTYQFVGLDEAQKLHGRKQNYTWINEAIEARKESFDQLSIRTTEQLLLDYNPSTDTHWIYDSVIPRDDCTFIKSTYKDNPFLEPEVVAEIERFEPTPENIAQGTADEIAWKVYGLGERATQRGLIFGDAEIVDEWPSDDHTKKIAHGLDFGFSNHPTTLVEIRLAHGELWIRELIYEKGLTNIKNPRRPDQPSIEGRLEAMGFSKSQIIRADSAEPKSIREMAGAGYNVVPAKKGQDSVRSGVDRLKRYKINIHKDSVNLIEERNNYKWAEDKDGNATNQPIDAFNHGWDSVRYGTEDLEAGDSRPSIRRL